MRTFISMRGLWAASVLAIGLLVGGCSEGEKEEKVNLGAQEAGLSGDAEAKVNSLAEISKARAGAVGLVPKIVPLLKDEDPVVRRTAAFALGEIGPGAKAAIPELKALMESKDLDQLRAVANALRAIDPGAVPNVKVDNVAPPEAPE